jgi:hypothetical protein
MSMIPLFGGDGSLINDHYHMITLTYYDLNRR